MLKEPLTPVQELEILEELKQFDTPTITNVVATYPGAPTCLNLYHPWDTNWYTDQRLKLMFPELGRTCGFAVTCTYGLPDPSVPAGPGMAELLHALSQSPKPAILLIKQDFPERIKGKVGLCGGNMATAFRSVGCAGIISDGPSRDLGEVREIGLQYMLTGASAGHGPMALKSVNTPVEICGMEVSPGEIVHMDENGAVKFPRAYLADVLELCRRLSREEEQKMSMLASTSDPDRLARYMAGNYS